MKSCIAFHEKQGIYLGVYLGHALFSNSALAFSSKAIRFNTEDEVRSFFDKVLPTISSEIIAVEVETQSTDNYVNVTDILKSGHRKHTETMIQNLPMMNETIH
jgi:hypothetical protein